MNTRSAIFGAFLAMVAGIFLPAPLIDAADYKLLQPIGGLTSISGTGLAAFIEYFNAVWPWVLSIGGGIAVLNGVIGGTMIMLSGSDSGMESAGKDKLKYSIVGLLIIAFAGMILRILNPIFYQ